MNTPDLRCKEFVDFLMDYIDGALEPESRRIFDAHVGDCPDCRAYLESYRTTLSLLKSVAEEPDAAVPDEVPETLVAAVMAAREKSR